MKQEITFQSEEGTCAGILYLPEGFDQSGAAPAVVMANALTAVKEQVLRPFAERLAAGGFVTLAFDYRYLGASAGEPRGHIVPQQQLDDLRNAVSWLSQQPGVDPAGIGAWGASLGGGHVIHLGAFDRRIKAVVSVVPAVDNHGILLKMMGPEGARGFLDMLAQGRTQRYGQKEPAVMQAVAVDGTPSMLQGAEAYDFYTGTAAREAPSWLNQVTVESVEKLMEYTPGQYVHLLSPTPLRMIVAERDAYLPADIAREAFERAGDPKDLVMLACGHSDVYGVEPWFTRSAEASLDWFTKHLTGA